MKTLIQAAVVTLFAASAAQAQQAVQWRVQDGGNGHWYQLVIPESRVNIEQALLACQEAGGDLASISSASENTFVFEIARQKPALWTLVWPGATQISGPWIGARFVAPSWQWSDGSPWGFTAWSTGNPNYMDEEHAVLFMGEASGPPTSRWNNIQPYYLNWGYVVEWSADCNGDGVVDFSQCRDGTLSDFDGDNSPDCCESGAPCVASNYPVQWRTSDGGNGHWYQLVAAPGIGWSSASGYADALGATLASLTTPAENSFVVMAFAGRAARFPWIGLRQAPDAAEPAGGWAWVSGEPLSWANWSPSEPNGDGSFDADQANIWLVDEPDRPLGTWNDWHSGGPDGYVLEWSADCNSDGIVDYGQILQGQLADANADGVPDICQVPTCVDADLFRDFNVNGADLGILLSQWGSNTTLTVADINDDGAVDGADLGLLLSFWGACP